MQSPHAGTEGAILAEIGVEAHALSRAVPSGIQAAVLKRRWIPDSAGDDGIPSSRPRPRRGRDRMEVPN
jgi:hypothetical protein